MKQAIPLHWVTFHETELIIFSCFWAYAVSFQNVGWCLEEMLFTITSRRRACLNTDYNPHEFVWWFEVTSIFIIQREFLLISLYQHRKCSYSQCAFFNRIGARVSKCQIWWAGISALLQIAFRQKVICNQDLGWHIYLLLQKVYAPYLIKSRFLTALQGQEN